MRIGIDATSWHNNRGYGRHARSLIRELVRLDSANRYTLFFDSREGAGGLPPNAAIRLVAASRPAAVAAAASGRRSLADMWAVSRAISREPLDLVLFPTIYSYVPVWTAARKLVIIHDVIAETYPHLTLPRLPARVFWKTKVALGRWQADALVTVSEYSRRRIVEYFRVPPESVFVVGEAGDPAFRRLPGAAPTPLLGSLGLDGRRPAIVYVGGFSPHKNLEALVGAFAALAREERFRDTLLVMVGEYKKETFHSYFGTIAAQVERLGLQDRVIFPGYLPDEELAVLLNLSTVLALPSLMEGFGLPAVEAAACGCPVVATKASPLAELLGEGVISIEPEQGALERGLRAVLDSPGLRARMGEAAHRAASALTWEAAARQMMEVMRKVGHDRTAAAA
jgi:glycosyltransferase involved in cell wall biosynthesis